MRNLAYPKKPIVDDGRLHLDYLCDVYRRTISFDEDHAAVARLAHACEDLGVLLTSYNFAQTNRKIFDTELRNLLNNICVQASLLPVGAVALPVHGNHPMRPLIEDVLDNLRDEKRDLGLSVCFQYKEYEQDLTAHKLRSPYIPSVLDMPKADRVLKVDPVIKQKWANEPNGRVFS